MGLLKLLFGGKNRYEITCPNCKTKGLMYTKNGAREGIFEIVGKTEDGGLAIKECPSCHYALSFDSLSGKVRLDSSAQLI